MSADPTYPATFQQRQDGNAAVPAGVVLDIESGGVLKVAGVDKTSALAAAVANPAAGVAAGYKVARGVAAITGNGTVVTGLATVVTVTASLVDDADVNAYPGVTASIGDQAGAPAAGSVILKVWKPTAGGGAGNPTPIAATAPKNVNWIAVGT